MCKTRHFALFTAGFWTAAAMVCSGGDVLMLRGYLPAIGPEPLRFRTAEPAANTFLPLPPAPVKADSVPTPPVSEQAEPENPFALTESLAPAADTNATIMEAVSPPPIILQAPPATASGAPLPASEEPISPQLFLQYFNGGTNSARARNGASVEFTPPHGQTATPAPAAPNTATPSTSRP